MNVVGGVLLGVLDALEKGACECDAVIGFSCHIHRQADIVRRALTRYEDAARELPPEPAIFHVNLHRMACGIPHVSKDYADTLRTIAIAALAAKQDIEKKE